MEAISLDSESRGLEKTKGGAILMILTEGEIISAAVFIALSAGLLGYCMALLFNDWRPR